MIVSAAAVADYREALEMVVDGAARDLRQLAQDAFEFGWDDASIRDMLIDSSRIVVSEYQNISALAAEDFYLELRPESFGPFDVTRGGFSTEDHITRMVDRALRTGNDPEQVADRLVESASRAVQMPARKTIQLSSEKDGNKAAWARVPRGPKTCAFCSMLASRGFAYKTADSALYKASGGEYHYKCQCTAVPGWGENPEIEDYDLEAYQELYYGARAQTAGVVDLQETLSVMRSEYPDRVTDGDVT